MARRDSEAPMRARIPANVEKKDAILFGFTFRQVVILTVAAAWQSEFEWWAHVRIGRQVGLSDADIAAVRTAVPLALDEPVEQAALDVARATTTRGDLDDEEYARAREVLGDQALIEALTLVGYYALLALQMRVHRVPLPEGAEHSFS